MISPIARLPSACYPVAYDVTRLRLFRNHARSAAARLCLRHFPDGPGRDDTWINKRIRDLYTGLHQIGHSHSVEVWENDDLVGGLYGVSLGRAFFGESMFHRARDASKVALVHLVARLIAGGFALLDTQYVTEHLRTCAALAPSRYRGGATVRCSTRRSRARRISENCRLTVRSAAPRRLRSLRGAGSEPRARPAAPQRPNGNRPGCRWGGGGGCSCGGCWNCGCGGGGR